MSERVNQIREALEWWDGYALLHTFRDNDDPLLIMAAAARDHADLLTDLDRIGYGPTDLSKIVRVLARLEDGSLVEEMADAIETFAPGLMGLGGRLALASLLAVLGLQEDADDD